MRPIEGLQQTLIKCMERDLKLVDRRDYQKTMEAAVGGDLGKYLAKLDSFLASKEGRKLVE